MTLRALCLLVMIGGMARKRWVSVAFLALVRWILPQFAGGSNRIAGVRATFGAVNGLRTTAEPLLSHGCPPP
jgi:hypothetical protein